MKIYRAMFKDGKVWRVYPPYHIRGFSPKIYLHRVKNKLAKELVFR